MLNSANPNLPEDPIGAVDPTRVRRLNDAPRARGDYVLYWMERAQRPDWNHALEVAIRHANALGLPVVVGTGVDLKGAAGLARHVRFQIEGLAETRRALALRGIPLVVRAEDPADVSLDLAGRAALVVTDRNELRRPRAWRRRVARETGRTVFEVETDVIVPIETACGARAWAASTLRPRIQRALRAYLTRLDTTAVGRPEDVDVDPGLDLTDLDRVMDGLPVDRSVAPVTRFYPGGTKQARQRLVWFVTQLLPRYAEDRDKAHLEGTSGLSPYLRFGQISPLEVAIAARDADAPANARDAFLEALVVRRELAVNYVRYTATYDTYEALPTWSRRTLARHAGDTRDPVYRRAALERAETHDPIWNAAMREAMATGTMHDHLRMYWGKKILEWSPSPEAAYVRTLHFNDRYFLDGRDPGGYAGVGRLFGLHDRPRAEREIYGTARYMNDHGLRQRFDVDAYVARVAGLVGSGVRA